MGDDQLLLAVERLVKPYKMPTMQTTPAKSWVTVVEHDGLLKQLRDSTAGGIGSHAGGAGNDSSRLPFDAAAGALRDRIHEVVGRWVAEYGERPWPVDEDERTLIAWYRLHTDAYRRGAVDDARHGARLRQVRDWVETIEQMFNPPDVIPLSSRCPKCGQRWAFEPIHGDRVDALAVSYWRSGAEAIGKVSAACRNQRCASEWSGRHGLHLLMQEIADQERAADEALAEQLVTDSPDTGPVPVA